MKLIIALLGLTVVASAELIESKKYLFSADLPLKLLANEARHAHGEYGSFLAYDEKTGLGYAIVVVQNNVLKNLFRDNPDVFADSLNTNLKAYTGGMKLDAASLKQTPGKTLGNKSISYSFSSTGLREPGRKTFHNGVLLFYHNAFYTIEIHSVHDSASSEKALALLLSSLKLLKPE